MNKKDNKSTLTGLVLIGIIFVAYSIFFPYTPEETPNSGVTDTTKDTIKTEETPDPKDNLPNEKHTQKIIEKTDIPIEELDSIFNEKIKIVFTNNISFLYSLFFKFRDSFYKNTFN